MLVPKDLAHNQLKLHYLIIIINYCSTEVNIRPSSEEFHKLVDETLKGVPQLLLKHSYPLNGLLASHHLNRYQKLFGGGFDSSRDTDQISTDESTSRSGLIPSPEISTGKSDDNNCLLYTSPSPRD